jgi:5-methylcytosine-specific restriction endonuclease McrA
VQQLARSHWVAHIKGNKRNVPILGDQGDLEQFLFETPRQTLTIIGSGLRGLTNSRCFYCAGSVQEAEVDHFVPFALYPRDLAHNFVLAHKKCNGSKSDALAARSHLERWVQFIDDHDADLTEIGQAAGRIADASTSLSVARWGYSNAAQAGARAWVKSGTYEAVDHGYLECLA